MQTAVTVRGPIAPALLGTLRALFGDASTLGSANTTLVVEGTDRASARALLTLLWDVGHEVLSLTNRDAG